MVAVSYNSDKKCLKYSKCEIKRKTGVYIYFNLVVISYSLIILVKIRGVERVSQNPLSVKKITCPPSLNRCYYKLTDCQSHHLLKFQGKCKVQDCLLCKHHVQFHMLDTGYFM